MKEKLELLISSLKRKKPISFHYLKPGKNKGTRIGNVYAIFPSAAKQGKRSILIHILQTAGVTESRLPGFRSFNFEDLQDITVLEEAPEFNVTRKDYNPDWNGYKNAIAKQEITDN